MKVRKCFSSVSFVAKEVKIRISKLMLHKEEEKNNKRNTVRAIIGCPTGFSENPLTTLVQNVLNKILLDIGFYTLVFFFFRMLQFFLQMM